VTIPPVQVNFQTTGVTPAVQQINRLNASLGQTGRITGASAGGFKKMQNGVSNLALGLVGLRGASGKVAEGLLLMGAGSGPVLALAATVAVLAGAYRLLTRESRDAKAKQDALTDSFIKSNENLPGQDRVEALRELVRLKGELAKGPQLDPFSMALQGVGDKLGITGPLSRGNQIKKAADLEKAFHIEAVTKIADARRKAQIAGFKRELQDAENQNDSYQQANEQQYAQGLQGVKTFYDRKRGLIQEGVAAEIAALEKERDAVAKAPAFTPEDRINRTAAVADLEQKIQDTRAKGDRDSSAATAEQMVAERALADARLGYEQQIQGARGNTLAFALAAIEQEARKFDEVLAKQNVGQAERNKLTGEFREVMTQRAKFADAELNVGRELAALDRDRLAIENQIATGKITQHDGDKAIAALEQQRLPALRQMAASMAAFAASTKDEELIAAAADLNASLNGMAAGADLAGQQMAQFKADVESGLTGDLSQFFTSGIEEARSFGEAIGGLGRSIVKTIQSIVAEMVAAAIVRKLVGGVLGFSGGGVVGSVRGNQTQSGFAAGGYVSGPGGPTSDSIAARLSNGEFVVNARATRDNLGLLEAINASPFRVQGYRRGYAMGGLVESSPMGSLSATLHASSDPGVILKIVDSNFPVMVQNHRKNIRDTTR
jgi:hypothetical protein